MPAHSNRSLRVAIVGAGASGIYAAEALLKQDISVVINIFESLPAPYGLVRYGVAPDHPKIKSVTKLYDRILANEQVYYFGNVTLGKNIYYKDLKTHFDAIIYATGAITDRQLNIPGEDLAGSLSATEFVAWYNGHPDFVNLKPNLNISSVAVVGMGNVALDVCRILAKTPEELTDTDISDQALSLLKTSQVQDIYMLGRRGPAQAKFSSKELRELVTLTNAEVLVNPQELERVPKNLDNTAKANLKILQDLVNQPAQNKPRRLHLRFFVSPKGLLGNNQVQSVKLEKNRLLAQNGYLNAVGTGVYETLPAGMVLRSVGYKGKALEGVPFNEQRGIIPNQEGRVLTLAGESVLGEYCTGWIKRGPKGVIGTNKADSVQSVKQLLADIDKLPSAEISDQPAVNELLTLRGANYFSFADWQYLDQLERQAGEAQKRPRIKFTDVKEMYNLCQQKNKNPED